MKNEIINLKPKFLLNETKKSTNIENSNILVTNLFDKKNKVSTTRKRSRGMIQSVKYAGYSPEKSINIINNIISSQKITSSILPESRSRKRGVTYVKKSRERFKEKGTKLSDLLKNIRIEIAETALTKQLSSDKKYDYLKSEMGMNIVMPQGKIKEMRFSINLNAKDQVIAIDGFPKNKIDQKTILTGKVKVAINKTFYFIPEIDHTLANGLSEIIDANIEICDFKIGNLKNVIINFSGGKTSKPEWHFKGKGIQNELTIGLTIRKPKEIDKIKAEIKAVWSYDPGIFKDLKFESDEKTIQII